jgi:glycine cleavage system H protein
MENPKNLSYTKEHEWARLDGEIATVGITDYAQHALTDIVFVELPKIGAKVEQFKRLAAVESVKSVSDVYAPMSGEVIEVNEELKSKPEMVNADAFGKGWIAKIKVSKHDEKKNLMDSTAYDEYLKQHSH